MTSTVPEQLIFQIRPAIRGRSPYIVGGDSQAPDVKLNQNESPFDLPEDLKKEILESFLEIPFNRYPREHPYDLIRALSDKLNHPPEGILVGNGSNELTYTLGLCLINPGAPVVLPTPMFSLYKKVILLYDGVPISTAPNPGLHVDLDAVHAAIRLHSPSLTIITTPNNPTGLSVPFDAIESLLKESPGFLLVDEAYVEFTSQRSALELMDQYPNLLILRTFSKAFGLAGMRIGFLLGHPPVIQEFLKSRLPFVVDPLAETVALALMRKPEIIASRVQEIIEERDALVNALKKLPDVKVIPSDANFLLLKTPVAPSILMKKLTRNGVLVRNMEGYSELAGYLRVNAGSKDENKVFLRALEDTMYSNS